MTQIESRTTLDVRSTKRLQKKSTFRPDIEGLRAIAVLVVLIYHLNPALLPGGFAGVDIFFVISGFLITSHLLGEVDQHGRIRLGQFYSRRIRRLIPASFVALMATSVGVAIFVPRYVWHQFGIDIAAAGAYVVNWVFATRSVDYLAEDSAASPVQHFWSLAVEEQFYLLWPLLIIALVAVSRRLELPRRATVAVGAAGIVLASLAFAVYLVARGDVAVYFMTTSRLWELAVGALVAVCLGWIHSRTSQVARSVLVVVGIGLIAVTVGFLDGTGWPGFPALVPTLGTAAVIVGGGRDRGRRPERILGIAPLVWLGGLSYSLYLWHAPLIVIAHYKWVTFTWPQMIFLAGLAICLAWLSARLVEDPVRFSKWLGAQSRRGFALGLACMVVTVGVGITLASAGPSNVLVPPKGATPAGAAALPDMIDLAADSSKWNEVEWALPSAADALADVPAIYGDGCQQTVSDDAPISCTYGDLDSKRVMALVGDSKAAQWLSALDAFAKQEGFRLVTFAKSSCPLADASVLLEGRDYPSCHSWNTRVLSELRSIGPEIVVTSQVRGEATASNGIQTQSAMVDGLESTWRKLADMGAKVVVIGDSPQTGMNVYECVAEYPNDLSRCTYDRATAIQKSALPAQEAAVIKMGGSELKAGEASALNPSLPTLLNLNDVICPSADRCPAIVGNVLVYRAGSHITDTYVRSIGDRLSRMLNDVGVTADR